MKNWKSFISWLLFMLAYNYSLYTDKPEGIVYITGLFAVFMSLAMMFRSEFTADMIAKLIDNIKLGR